MICICVRASGSDREKDHAGGWSLDCAWSAAGFSHRVSGGFNWPIWIAQDKGYFARGGIEVALTPIPNSVFQLTNLIDGKFDIAMAAIDNVIAYMGVCVPKT
jgi:NMT1/THI5 like protein